MRSGDGHSDATYSALPGGVGAFCYGRTSVRWYTDARLCGKWNSPGETQDAQEVGVSPGAMECAEDSAYIRPGSVVESPVYVWSVTGSLLFGSPLDMYGAYSSRLCLLRIRRGLCWLGFGSPVV